MTLGGSLLAMLTHTYGSCSAFLDPLAGLGLLAMPSPDGDALGDAYGAAVRELGRQGWEVTTGPGGLWCEEGRDLDGRDVIALHHGDPIDASAAAMERIAETLRDLRAAAGVVTWL